MYGLQDAVPYLRDGSPDAKAVRVGFLRPLLCCGPDSARPLFYSAREGNLPPRARRLDGRCLRRLRRDGSGLRPPPGESPPCRRLRLRVRSVAHEGVRGGRRNDDGAVRADGARPVPFGFRTRALRRFFNLALAQGGSFPLYYVLILQIKE